MKNSAAAAVAAALVATAWCIDVLAQDRPPQPGAARGRADPTQRDLNAYRLRVEDEIEIAIHEPGAFDPKLTRTFTVPANGEVSYPPIGRIQLVDRTAAEIEGVIAQRLKDENYLTNPNVGCFVTRYAVRSVSVVGALRGTVALPVQKDLRILEVVSRLEGGLDSEGADFSRVVVKRVGPDGTTYTIPVNLDAVFSKNDDQQNIVVREGDIISVPRLQHATASQAAEFVYVLGKLNQRGRVPFLRGRRPFTLMQLVAYCGDFQEFADRNRVRIIRYTETGRKSEVVDFDDILDLDRPDYDLQPDDFIYVPESFL